MKNKETLLQNINKLLNLNKNKDFSLILELKEEIIENYNNMLHL